MARTLHQITFTVAGTTLLLTAAIHWNGRALNIAESWFIAITLVTLFTFGYDKAIAGSPRVRVPEKLFYSLTLAGGTLGVLLGMPLFNHKTAKRRFISKLLTIITVQFLAFIAWQTVLRDFLAI